MIARLRVPMAGLVAMSLVTGCSSGIQTPLPEVAATPEKPIVAEQKRAALKGMQELSQKAQTHQSEALKEIERTR